VGEAAVQLGEEIGKAEEKNAAVFQELKHGIKSNDTAIKVND
jgi:hypothetical protein